MTTPTKPPINSREWWDEYFRERWDALGGRAQTGHFMEQVVASLPATDLACLRSEEWEILDWGSAFGEGVDVLARQFPHSVVSGLDFSTRAIEQARKQFPQEFIWSETGAIPREFDCIVTSNCLEHFEDPLAVVTAHLQSCRFLYVVLVPFNEWPLHEQHRAQFRRESFPEAIGRFLRLACRTVEVDRSFWPGRQLLVVYGSLDYLTRRQRFASSADARGTALVSAALPALYADIEKPDDWQGRSRRLLLCLERADEEARDSEVLRRQMELGIASYHTRLEQDLAVFRALRSWKVMLALRKAHSLLQAGPRGAAELLRWLAGPRRGDSRPYELEFPRLSTYMPAERVVKAAAPRQTCYDVVILPVFDFSFRFQRAQHVGRQLARRGHRVFWVSTAQRCRSNKSAYETELLEQNLWEVRLRASVPNIYLEELQPGDEVAVAECLEQLYCEWTIAESCVIVQFPFWRRIGLRLHRLGARLVYDCMDDWDAFPGVGTFARREGNRLASECDLLVVTAETLRQKYVVRNCRPLLVRNGVDHSFFASASRSGLLDAYQRPIVGYMGAIGDWIDFGLLYEVARSRPMYSFVLVGGVGLEAEVKEPRLEPLRTLPNVVVLGHRDYSQIPQYLAEFDVCLIPFVLNDLTRATDPVKLYEYLSLGKPVVSTALPELGQCGDLVYIGGDAEDFARKVDDAVAEEEAGLRRRRRVAFAATSTWERRVDDLRKGIRQVFPTVSILIVTHNSAEFVRPCLESITRNTTYPNYEVIVADNGSEDGTPALVQSMMKVNPNIRFIAEVANTGYSRANNRVARESRGAYLIFLNADTIVTPGWVERLIRPSRADASVGVVVAVTNFAGNETCIKVDYSDTPQMERFAQVLAQKRMGLTMDISVAPLFCTLVPRHVWEEVGELDERYEVGMFEDDDFSLRVLRSGRRVVTAEDCFVHHFGHGSFRKMPREQFDALFDMNRRRFEQKWQTGWVSHRRRPGVEDEPRQFTPEEFV